MQVNPGVSLALALVLLVCLAVTASLVGKLGHHLKMPFAALRAVVQLTFLSTIVVFAVQHLWAATLVHIIMFSVGVVTTARRVGTLRCWPWTAMAMAAGVLPVLAIVFLSGVAPFNGYGLIPIGGSIIGNTMTAHTLVGRRVFAKLRDDIHSYEAALSLGLIRADAIRLVTETVVGEAMIPNIDSTRTVGLVTMPGAFIGVLLGGGTALQAGASQLLVLIGIMAGQAITVTVANTFIAHAKLLPDDLRAQLVS